MTFSPHLRLIRLTVTTRLVDYRFCTDKVSPDTPWSFGVLLDDWKSQRTTITTSLVSRPIRGVVTESLNRKSRAPDVDTTDEQAPAGDHLLYR